MLELKNICYEVNERDNGERKEILRNINMVVDRGAFFVITGPNGGGKSTLSKIIMGIEKPTGGSILFEGEDITSLSITERAQRGIGFAFQQPVRFKGLRIKDLLRMASGTNITTVEACDYLSRVGLCAADYIDRELNASLSGGEMKRIEIAMLIARKVKLSIFDEPEAGIDLWSFNNLIQVFDEMQKAAQGSIIIVSHQERILDIADKIAVIADGEITAYDSKDKLLPSLLSDTEDCEFFRRRT